MKRSSRQIGFLVSAAVTLLALSACQKVQTVPEVTEQAAEIVMEPTSSGLQTRAADLYESTAGLIAEMSHSGEGSSYIHIDAYQDGTTTKYIDNSHFFYFLPSTVWRFADGGGNIIHYYWPPDDSYLNFLAYAPESLTYTGITIGPYTDRHPTLNCDLPLADNQTYSGGTINMKEFIYSFVPERNKTNNGDAAVALPFIHPLAAVYVKVAHAKQRMTLNSVTFKRIYNKGTGAYNSVGPTTDWTPDTSEGAQDFTITIGKTMGTDMYIGDTFGPFIVMPQALTGRTPEDIKMVVNYTLYGGSATDSAELTITSIGSTSWNPGMKYTYALDLGSDDGIVTVYVEVASIDWDDQGSHTETNVD